MTPLRGKGVLLPWLLLLALAAGHALLAWCATLEKSPTFDEPAHLTGGYTFNALNDYRMQPENGLLPQRWHALPAAVRGVNYPDLENAAWHRADVWRTSFALLYQQGNDADWLIRSARAMNTLFGLGTVVLVGVWAWRLFGRTGALVAAFFAALCPTLLAHSGLATSDMAATFFFLAATSAWWWHLHDRRPGVLLLSLITFGLACLAKFSAVLLLPTFALLALVRGTRAEPMGLGTKNISSALGRWGFLTGSGLLHGLAAVAIIWAAFGFRYAALNPTLPGGELYMPWDKLLEIGGLKAAVIQWCRDWQLLPEGFLYGFAYVLKHSEARSAFLDGEYSIYGWVSFFPKTFLYKTPPALLGALLLTCGGLLFLGRKEGADFLKRLGYRTAPLLVFFILYWAVSLTSHLNIGHRHILSTYPALYILTGALGWMAVHAWQGARTARVAACCGIAGLLGWHAATAAWIHPHHLAYFSPLAGGPTQGHHHLVDSSLDWGQDLPGLKRWLDENRQPEEPVYLSYFGMADPNHYGIHANPLPSYPAFYPQGNSQPLKPGLYAVSATMLVQAYTPLKGYWSSNWEDQFQQLRAIESILLEASSPPPDSGLTAEQWTEARSRYESLRFARLCFYLRGKPPENQAGYSIFIFRLTQAEITAVTGDLHTLTEAIEHLASAKR